ncbi:LamG domain-containing protein [Clavibacter lycopersici]|uniref:LamG domain-containing protein n=1 Tax=Clavibacter lycopersici TaxID=2301718 RepID=A0A399SSU8_9MICO|nr:LamG domain-containing protein [Clavibacter lycopersici]RIJ46398.1 LamG domain-containing protein [Clavibacter lycopersici]RIJ62055.1 LamG domain-containing protein [Clavibacter lycopersici]
MSVVARLLGRRAAPAAAGRRTPRLAAIAASVSAAALGAVLLLTPGTNGAYTAAITNSNNTAASSAAYFTCSSAFAADKANALFAYPLNEASAATTAVDAATGSYPGTYRGGMTSETTTPRACARDTGGAYVLQGNDFVTNTLQTQAPATFSTEVWFKTTTKGGKLIGFGNSQTGSSSAYDRHTYVSTSGQLIFGTYNNGAYQTLTSPNAVTDGNWHHMVSTMSPGTGMALYLDGVRVAGNTAFTAPESNSGFWRIGYDNTSGWPNVGGNYFVGSMRFAAVYKTALTATQVLSHYTAGR